MAEQVETDGSAARVVTFTAARNTSTERNRRYRERQRKAKEAAEAAAGVAAMPAPLACGEVIAESGLPDVMQHYVGELCAGRLSPAQVREVTKTLVKVGKAVDGFYDRPDFRWGWTPRPAATLRASGEVADAAVTLMDADMTRGLDRSELRTFGSARFSSPCTSAPWRGSTGSMTGLEGSMTGSAPSRCSWPVSSSVSSRSSGC